MFSFNKTGLSTKTIKPKIAVLFDNFGPYHIARLKALAKQFQLLAIEQRSQSQEYLWRASEKVPFNRVLVLKEKNNDVPRHKEQALLNERLDEFNPNVVVVPGWASRQAVSGLAWAKANCVPAVVMSDSQEIDSTRSRWKEWVKSRLVGLFSAGLVGGKSHKAYLEKLGMPAEHIHVGYDVVDNTYFSTGADLARSFSLALRSTLELPANYFLVSNRFIEEKNLPSLLDAYAGYVALSGDAAWSLVMLGDGYLKIDLLEQIDRLELSTQVLLPGFKQYEELPQYLGLAGVFILASTKETWGLVVNEAMAAGLPVLVSNRCGCASDLVDDGRNGFTFDPYDVPALANLMIHVASPACDRAAMGRASQEIIAHWTPETFARNLEAAVNTAMKRGSSKASVLDRLLLWGLSFR